MLNDLLVRVGGARRLLVALVGLSVAAAIFIISRIATAPTWVPAINNVPLSNASDLTDRLDQAGIRYKLDRGGSEILVAEPDVARARVTLAKDGLPGGTRPGLELFDRASWGWNDFTQRVNYRRALEGELERTISRMRGVERAEVHLAISEQSAFRRADERPITASVLLALKASGQPGPEIVQGIAHLVSASVDGLAPENVSIHDETGRQWSEPNDRGTLAGLTTHQLRMQQDVEQYLAKKATNMITDMVGSDNARVQVSAAINFDRVDRTTQAIDPDKQALSTEQKAEITPGAQGGAGSTNIANAYENTKSTEVFSGAIGNIKRLTVAVLVNDKRAAPSGPTDTVPRYEARTAAELARIETLVRSAVGIDSARGDAVSVVSLPFEKVPIKPEPVVPPDLMTRVERYERPVFTGLGLVLAFVLAMMALKPLRSAAAGGGGALTAGATQSALAGGQAGTLAGQGSRPALAFSDASTEMRDRVVSTVVQNPDSAARLMKTWIKDR